MTQGPCWVFIALHVILLQARSGLHEISAEQRKVQLRLATLKQQRAAVTAKRSAAGESSLQGGLHSPQVCCRPSALPCILLFVCGMGSSLWSCCTQCIYLCAPLTSGRNNKEMQA